MHFKNREDAGHRLAEALAMYKNKPDVVVVALPRGGVVLGRVVADTLKAPLDIVVPRKIPAPENAEYAVGALAETGEVIWNPGEHERLDDAYVKKAIANERAEAKRRLAVYRAGLPKRNFKKKTVIVVDDGIATGQTMRAALLTVKTGAPHKIVIAVPVAPAGSDEEFRTDADDVIILSMPALFGAIGAFYGAFPQVGDDEVVRLLHP